MTKLVTAMESFLEASIQMQKAISKQNKCIGVVLQSTENIVRATQQVCK
jgi:hypothetical protein